MQKALQKCAFLMWHNLNFALFMAATQNREHEIKALKLSR